MLETLTKIIREHTGDESIIINEDMDLKADLGLNSLELVNLVCVVEDEFDIEIPDRNIKDFRTVKDVIQFIEEQL
ncbi:MAG: acyl carrier protein [Frisingicoccus sp.]|uniref:acyl carrier protein n=1 Tax=Frisingicoccus sp. TaxID=1918627 RepID=UPI0026272EDD|nr:acyl carrier protein [Frisingicoccus sp.]MDD6231244.1 acyl carrier protein [Frisingicoccus sp.]